MLEHEKRLDNKIPFGQLVDGEPVEICTKMGHSVSRGIVLSVTPHGVIVQEEGGETKFYTERFHLFSSPISTNPKVVAQNQLNDMSLDARINAKLTAMDEAGDPTPDDTGAKPIEPGASDSEYKDKKGGKDKEDKDGDGKEKDKEKDKKTGKLADPDSSIDVNKLPDDVKQAIIKADEMDEAKLNMVISDVSGAALKALKRSGVSETQIYDVIKKISESVYSILTGKKPGESR